MPIDFELARHAMVEQQVRPWEVLDPRVLEVLATLRREDFVLPRHRRLAFTDMQLPLEHGEVMFKPVVEGRLLQALDLSPEDEVLEIGTGSGFVTACLARLARDVVSVDIHADFVERARDRLAATGLANVRVEVADALSYAPGRKFDAVAVTGAVSAVPAAFFDWLKPGGRMFVVRGHAPAQEAVLLRGAAPSAADSLFETDVPFLQGFAPVERFAL
jgi:protein-L-isoaspartate(D-aspartate) O-methyltransferase